MNHRAGPQDATAERGSAIAENVMTMSLLVAVFLVVVQFAYAVHVRSTLTLAASEGARAAARVNAPSGVGAATAREFTVNSVGGRYANHISEQRSSVDGVSVHVVTMRAPIPVLGPFGVGLTLTTSGRAVVEDRS